MEDAMHIGTSFHCLHIIHAKLVIAMLAQKVEWGCSYILGLAFSHIWKGISLEDLHIQWCIKISKVYHLWWISNLFLHYLVGKKVGAKHKSLPLKIKIFGSDLLI